FNPPPIQFPLFVGQHLRSDLDHHGLGRINGLFSQIRQNVFPLGTKKIRRSTSSVAAATAAARSTFMIRTRLDCETTTDPFRLERSRRRALPSTRFRPGVN